jgi:hypothetical protein
VELTKHNYYVRLIEALKKSPELRAAGIHNIDIRHDDWCAIYKGGYCNCEPEIALRCSPQKQERRRMQ